MTDGDAIHAKILAEPDEDVHRLAYADWLEENGQPERAEFVRVQCRIAKLEPSVTRGRGSRVHKDLPKLRARETQLIEAHASDWFPLPTGMTMVEDHYHWRRGSRGLPYPGIDIRGATHPTERVWIGTSNVDLLANYPTRVRAAIRRGFVEAVTCGGDDWVRHGDDILAVHPVRAVKFTDAGPEVRYWFTDFRIQQCRHEVAGRVVEVPERDAALARYPDGITRLVLSARWPRIPPEGWTFAPPAFDEARHPRGEDGRFAPPLHIT